MKSIVKDAIQRTLNLKDLAMAEGQDPLFMLRKDVNSEEITH